MTASPSPSDTRHRVLVVDDAANLRDLLTMLLEAEDDFEVVGIASDGQQALEIADDVKPDVILLDLLMPVMDGLEALPILRERFPNASIVIFSGFAEDSLAENALAGGADAYVEKGVSVTSLVDQLRELRAAAAS